MMFIAINEFNGNGQKPTKTYINFDEISVIREMSNGTRIITKNDKIFDTESSIEDVIELIKSVMAI